MGEELNISSKLACRICGNTTKQNSNILNKQYQYLVKFKLPWYAWNGWIDDTLKTKGVKNSAIGSFLKLVQRRPNLNKLFEQEHFEWACDQCFEKQTVIEGIISEQTFCDNPPYLAYVDKYKVCQTCKSTFKFSKEEQKYWYEERKFWVQSSPENCIECRKIIRNDRILNTKLSNLIKDLDDKNSEQLIEISKMYFELGKVAKGKHFAKLASSLIKMKN
jgi:hypothetical protein